MLAYSSKEEISSAVEAKYTRITLTRLSKVNIDSDKYLSLLSEYVYGFNDNKKLLNREEFRDYVYEHILNNDDDEIKRFLSEYENVVYTIDYNDLISGLAETPSLNQQLVNFARIIAKKYNKSDSEVMNLLREYIDKHVSMHKCNEYGSVERFLFKALHSYFEKTMNEQGRLKSISIEARVSDNDTRSYREVSGISLVSESDNQPNQNIAKHVNIYDLVIKIIKGSRLLYIHRRDSLDLVEGTEYEYYYYDLVSYLQYYQIRTIASDLQAMFNNNKVLVNRISKEDQNFDLSREAPAGTMRAKYNHRTNVLDMIMSTGIETSIKNFSKTYGDYIELESEKEADKGSITIEAVTPDKKLVLEKAKLHLSQILFGMLAVNELTREAERVGYTIFDLPIPIFRIYKNDWYKNQGLVSPLSYLNPDTPIITFISLMELIEREQLMERNDESVKRIQIISSDILGESSIDNVDEVITNSNDWGMINIKRFAGMKKDSQKYEEMYFMCKVTYVLNYEILKLYRNVEDAVGLIYDAFFKTEDGFFINPRDTKVIFNEIEEYISSIKPAMYEVSDVTRREIFTRSQRLDNLDIDNTEKDSLNEIHSARDLLRQRVTLINNYSQGRNAYESILSDGEVDMRRGILSVTDGSTVLEMPNEVDRFMCDTESCIWAPNMIRGTKNYPPDKDSTSFNAVDFIIFAYEQVTGEEFEWIGTSDDFFKLSGVLETYHKLMILLDLAEVIIQQRYYEEYNTFVVTVSSPEIVESFTEILAVFDYLSREKYKIGMQKLELILQSLDSSFCAAGYKSHKYYSYLLRAVNFKLDGIVPFVLQPYFHLPFYYEEDRMSYDIGAPHFMDFKMNRNHIKAGLPNEIIVKIGYTLFTTINDSRIRFIRDVLNKASDCLSFASVTVESTENWVDRVLREESDKLQGTSIRSEVGCIYDERGYERNFLNEYVKIKNSFDESVEGYIHRSGYVVYINREKREVAVELLT